MKFRALWLVLILALVSDVPAVVPESGIYWRPDEPGRAYYIDYQRGTVFFVAYAYEDGEPVFYAGSGSVSEGAGEVPVLGEPLFSVLGYNPWNFVTVELYRTTGGACLTCLTRTVTPQRVGTATLYFDRVGLVVGYFLLDTGQARQFVIQRFNFAYPDVIETRLRDITGDWIFADASDPSSTPLRFNFTLREESVPNITQSTPRPWELRLIDATRNARWVCIGDRPGLDPGKKPDACELRVNGEAVLWARFDDIGLNRILAGRGPIQTQGERFRGLGDIVGMRVQ